MRLKRRGDSGGLGDGAQLAVVLLLGGLNPALDCPHGVEILGEPGAIPGSYSAPKIADAGSDRVENASVGANLGLSCAAIGAFAAAEHAFEQSARIVLHRKRCPGSA